MSSTMITIVKLNAQKKPVVQYQGELIERLPHGVVVQASWTSPTRDLGYTSFEPGDQFTEYFYTDRCFNIFAILSTSGQRKGWYCNIAEPAIVFEDHIEQIDLLLDVWINPRGEALILDEDEFAADTMLSQEQRSSARQGLQELLYMLAARQEVFSGIMG
ncbi:MAG: DUF402 domain-containing protein [Ktedonobacteraceae bacterium]|nr:DUF402 domain-containing protein [Ktedonobacteraceae bacterium]